MTDAGWPGDHGWKGQRGYVADSGIVGGTAGDRTGRQSGPVGARGGRESLPRGTASPVVLKPGLFALVALCLFLPAVIAGQGDFPDVCADDPQHNLVENCGFDDQLDHWETFLEDGSRPAFSLEDGSPDCHSPDCPALVIEAQDWFVGGIYQQVKGVVPGQAYWANVIWLVYDPAGALDNTVGRRVGIDPIGGTNPGSPDVVWSQDVWKSFANCIDKICRELQVEAVARNTTMTLFVRIEDTWKDRRDEFQFVPPFYFDMTEHFWIDDVGMIPVTAPTPTPFPTPTSTPLPTSTVISPTVGGRLVSNDADRSVTIEFPPGAVTESTVITYAYQLPMAIPDDLAGVDRFFQLEAVGGAAPITQFNRPVTIAVRYPAIHPLKRDTISLYRLSGTLWVTEGITLAVRTEVALTSTTSHFSSFALLGGTNRCYIPAILK